MLFRSVDRRPRTLTARRLLPDPSPVPGSPPRPAPPRPAPPRPAELYRAKPVEPQLGALVAAAIEGDVPRLRAAWRPELRAVIARLGREEASHPLLHAAHRLHGDCVRFLLDECGLSPRQRASAHPYTGDSLTVTEMQASARARAARGAGRAPRAAGRLGGPALAALSAPPAPSKPHQTNPLSCP